MKLFAQIPLFLAFTLSVFCAQINIRGLDKPTLLKALWGNPGTDGSRFRKAYPFSNKQALEACKDYIDYFGGRSIKTDISGDVADSTNYDRDAGEGMFQSIVNDLRYSKLYYD